MPSLTPLIKGSRLANHATFYHDHAPVSQRVDRLGELA